MGLDKDFITTGSAPEVIAKFDELLGYYSGAATGDVPVVISTGSATIGNVGIVTSTINSFTKVNKVDISTPQKVSWDNSDVINTYKEIAITKPSTVGKNLQLVLNTNSVDSDFEVNILNLVTGLITTGTGTQINSGTRYALLCPTLIPKLVLQSVNRAFSYTGTGTYVEVTTSINTTTASDVAACPITTGIVGDALYIGDTVRFDSIRFSIGTPGVYTTSTLVWEYYTGTDWTAFGTGTLTDNTSTGTGPFTQATGLYDLNFSIPSDWAVTTVSTSTTNKYWIRCRMTVEGTITTAPLLTQAWIRSPAKSSATKVVNIDGAFVSGDVLISLNNLTAISATGACDVWAWWQEI